MQDKTLFQRYHKAFRALFVAAVSFAGFCVGAIAGMFAAGPIGALAGGAAGTAAGTGAAAYAQQRFFPLSKAIDKVVKASENLTAPSTNSASGRGSPDMNEYVIIDRAEFNFSV